MNLKGRHFLKLLDYTPEEIEYLINLAFQLKEKRIPIYYGLLILRLHFLRFLREVLLSYP